MTGSPEIYPLPLRYRALRGWGHARFIPFGVRDRLVRRLADPETMIRTPFSADFFGLIYTGDLSRFLDWETYFYGAYEPEILSLIDHLIDGAPGACFVDIGANAGQHSLFAARRGIDVFAFEPWETARAQFERNIAINELHNIRLFACALGDADKETDFYAPEGGNTGTGSLYADYNPGNNTRTIRVEQRTGDALFADIGIEGTAILKIDVEGAERSVLSGLSEFIRLYRPTIVMEFSDATRRSFENRADLNAVFGPAMNIHTVNRVRDRFRLSAFDFDAPQGNILIEPA